MLGLTLRYSGPRPKGIRKHLKVMYGTLGEQWHTKFRKKHFTRRGAAEYRYTRRSKKYEARKFRLYGHRLPLVYTGRSRLLTRMRNVRATGTGCRVVMRAPAFNLRPRTKGGQIHPRRMRDEMTIVSRREAKALAQRGKDVMGKRLSQRRRTRVTKI